MGKLEKGNKDRMKKLKTASVAWRINEGRHKISWITNKRRGFTRRKERPLQDFFLAISDDCSVLHGCHISRGGRSGQGVADRGLTLESLPLIPILIHERSGQTSSTWATKEMVNYMQKYEAWLAAK